MAEPTTTSHITVSWISRGNASAREIVLTRLVGAKALNAALNKLRDDLVGLGCEELPIRVTKTPMRSVLFMPADPNAVISFLQSKNITLDKDGQYGR